MRALAVIGFTEQRFFIRLLCADRISFRLWTIIHEMCGRFTQAYTWRESVALYGLMQPALNLQPRYDIAPTATMCSEVWNLR